MKVRVDCDGGIWRVFVEDKDGLYRELDPVSCEFAHIDIDTQPAQGRFILSFVKFPEAAPNAALMGRASAACEGQLEGTVMQHEFGD